MLLELGQEVKRQERPQSLAPRAFLVTIVERTVYCAFLSAVAVGREVEANENLRRAYERVMLVVNRLQSESLRQYWLRNVWVNGEILAEWAARETE